MLYLALIIEICKRIFETGQFIYIFKLYFTSCLVHTAEVRNDEETKAIILFKPDRIGHGTFIFPIQDRNNTQIFDLFQKANIPIGRSFIYSISFIT